MKRRLNVVAQNWNQNKDRPETINHAWNGSQEFYEERQRPAQRLGAHLGGEHRDPNTKGNCNDERQNRRNQSSEDERQSAELVVHRVPVAGGEELEAKSVPRELRTGCQLVDDENQDAQNGQTAKRHRRLKNAVRNLASRGS